MKTIGIIEARNLYSELSEYLYKEITFEKLYDLNKKYLSDLEVAEVERLYFNKPKTP